MGVALCRWTPWKFHSKKLPVLCKNIDALQKRAKRKFINNPVLLHLIGLNSPLKDKYLSSLSCSSLVKQQSDNKITSKYCKRPWCTICAPIRTAIRINNYSKCLSELSNLQLTTLTLPNVPVCEIKKSIQHFRKVFKQFRDSFNKRTGLVFKGVYNFEITYNATTSFAHPHIHIIHEGLEVVNILQKDGSQKQTNILIDYWLKNEKTSKLVAQDTRPCTDLIEGFKYTSKSVYSKRIDGKKQIVIPVVFLDKMYQQLVGVRCFQPFGIKAQTEANEDKQMDNLTAYELQKPVGSYIWKRHDWYMHHLIDIDTGEILHDYEVRENTTVIQIALSDYNPSTQVEKLYEKLTLNKNYHNESAL